MARHDNGGHPGSGRQDQKRIGYREIAGKASSSCTETKIVRLFCFFHAF